MKIQPHSLTAKMADALAVMRLEHPVCPLEWATKDRVQLFAECGVTVQADTGCDVKINGLPVVRDDSLRHGRVWLRVRWEAP